ncbi:hypothetical protein QQP08_015404 [Theobroma cacao]|nr:hypothetical protein QQP08_015404 [Theobroma cacao]
MLILQGILQHAPQVFRTHHIFLIQKICLSAKILSKQSVLKPDSPTRTKSFIIAGVQLCYAMLIQVLR